MTATQEKEAAYVKHVVRELWDEMWAKDGRKEQVFASCTTLRDLGEIAGLRIVESVRDEFKVPNDTASAMVASWLAHTRGTY